jgi:hypothetical protein
MNCASAIDLMGDAIEGCLAANLKEDFCEHVEACIPCGAYFEQLCFTRKALALLPPQSNPGGRRSELLKRFKNEFGDEDPNR